jgi:hypothetical protein
METAPESTAVVVAEMPVKTAATTVDRAGRPYALSVAWIET